jgi:hypothetical protein
MDTDLVLRSLLRLAAAALAAAYVVAGLFLIFIETELIGINPTIRFILGLLLVLYGIYRFVRALKKAPALK